MGLVMSDGFFDGGFVVVKVSSFGWIRSARVSQVMQRMRQRNVCL